MRRVFLLPTVAFLLLAVSACLTDFGDGPVTIEPIQGKVELRVGDFHPSEGSPPVVGILMRTEQIFGCMNYSLLHTLDQRGTDMHLLIHGASIGPICATAFGPATAINFAGIHPGEYTLYVHMRGRTDRYTLTVSASAIRLIPVDTTISRPMDQLVWRYPPFSFALYAGTMAGDEWLVTAFIDSLTRHIPVQEIGAPPDGRWPFARTTGGYMENARNRYYIYQHENQFQKAGSILREFAVKHLKGRTGVGIWIENWKREYYYSWVLAHQQS